MGLSWFFQKWGENSKSGSLNGTNDDKFGGTIFSDQCPAAVILLCNCSSSLAKFRGGVDRNEGTSTLYEMLENDRDRIFPQTFEYVQLIDGKEAAPGSPSRRWLGLLKTLKIQLGDF